LSIIEQRWEGGRDSFPSRKGFVFGEGKFGGQVQKDAEGMRRGTTMGFFFMREKEIPSAVLSLLSKDPRLGENVGEQ